MARAAADQRVVPLPPAAADAAELALMQRVGARLRAAREGGGLSRKALSDASGVSQRYLAQIETGLGNISLALLHRVAAALGLAVEDLVAAAPPDAGATAIAARYAAAPEETRAAVRRMLGANGGPARRVALIGLRGAGKTTLGRGLAEAEGATFVELNDEVEALGGMAVGDIIALYGQEGYRELEALALDRVAAAHDRVVLAVAGGVVGAPAVYDRLLSRFHAIWLRAAPEEHMARVRGQGDERPMEGHPDAMRALREILAARETDYRRAPAALDTGGRTPAQSLEDLRRLVAAEEFLGARAAEKPAGA